jgi:hypothetical protein
MSSIQDLSGQNGAQKARDAALQQRPKDLPWPMPGPTPVDCTVYWETAIQYYHLAVQYYESYDYKQGDYYLSRGNAYSQFAVRCAALSAWGAPASDDAPAPNPEKPYGAPDADALSQVLAQQRSNAQRLRDPNAPRPRLFDTGGGVSCDAYGWISWGYGQLALQAYANGDTAAADHYMSEWDTYGTMWAACDALAHTLP